MLDKIAQYQRLSYDKNGDIELTFLISKEFKREVLNAVGVMTQLALQGKTKLTLIVKPFREKRTIIQNKYYWKLLEKLKNVLRIGDDEAHVLMLKAYGQIAEDENGNKIIFSLMSHIAPVGILKYSKELGKKTLNVDGKDVEFTHYKALKGSSEMSTLEMSILIDGLISECKEVGIETDTPQEIARLKSLWESQNVQ